MSPSDLPWWGWLLCGVGAFVLAMIVGAVTETSQQDSGCGRMVLIAIIYLTALICTGIGIIRFVKWVWSG